MQNQKSKVVIEFLSIDGKLLNDDIIKSLYILSEDVSVIDAKVTIDSEVTFFSYWDLQWW